MWVNVQSSCFAAAPPLGSVSLCFFSWLQRWWRKARVKSSCVCMCKYPNLALHASLKVCSHVNLTIAVLFVSLPEVPVSVRLRGYKCKTHRAKRHPVNATRCRLYRYVWSTELIAGTFCFLWLTWQSFAFIFNVQNARDRIHWWRFSIFFWCDPSQFSHPFPYIAHIKWILFQSQ